MRFARRFICTMVLCACLREQGTHGKQKAQHKNVCINCTCYDQHKNKYNLWPLQNLDDPENPSFSKANGGYTYSYSPCLSFKLGPPDLSECRNNVAICRSTTDVYYQKLADQGGVTLDYDSDKKRLQLIYNKIVTWKPKVILICDPTIEDAIFDIVNVEKEWIFNLTHKCACPNTCLTDPPDPTSSSDPSVHSSPSGQNELMEEIFIPIGAGGFLLAVAGFVYYKRRRRQRLPHGIDEVDQGNNERRHLVDRHGDIDSYINPIGEERSAPLTTKSCDITVSKSKDEFNKQSASA